MDQKAILTDSRWQLAKSLKAGVPKGDRMVIKNIPARSYLTVTRDQYRILQRFQKPNRVPEILMALIKDRQCPPLRSLYELVLQSVEAHILVQNEAEVPVVPSMDWPFRIGPPVATGMSLALMMTGLVIALSLSVSLPGSTLDVLLGWMLVCVTLSIGYVLAAGVTVSGEGEVYHPRLEWRSLFPHFTVDLQDSMLSDRQHQTAAALARLAPGFMALAATILWAPGLSYMALAGLFYLTDPFHPSPSVEFLRAQYRQLRLSIHQELLFLQNRFFWSLFQTQLKHIDKPYLMLYSGYAVIWLGLVYYIHKRLFDLDGKELVDRLMHLPAAQWVVLGVLFVLLAGLVTTTAMGLWILLKNVAGLIAKSSLWYRLRYRPIPAEAISREAVMDLLKHSLLFKQCDEATRQAVAESVLAINVRPRRFIIREGEEGDCLYIIYKGRVEVVRELLTGRYERLAALGDGDTFGEIALLQHGPRTRSVRAIVETTLLALRYEAFHDLLIKALGVEKIQDILQKEAFLARLRLSQQWHPQAMTRFANLLQWEQVPKDKTVIHKGVDNQFFYLIYEGRFEVVAEGRRLETLVIGDFFGEISLLRHSQPVANVKAVVDSRVLRIHQNDFLHFLSSDFMIGLQFETISSRRLGEPIFLGGGHAYESPRRG